MRRGDPSDRHRHPVDGEWPADDIRGAPEVPLPESIADYRDTIFRRAESIFGIREATAGQKRNAKLVEEVGADEESVDRFPLAAHRQIEGLREHGPGDRAVEALLMLTNLIPDLVIPSGRVALLDRLARRDLCLLLGGCDR